MKWKKQLAAWLHRWLHHYLLYFFIFQFATVMFVLLLLTFALKSWRRSLDWQNEHNLFLSGLSVCPLNAKVHYNFAKMADAKQQTDVAVAEYKESIR